MFDVSEFQRRRRGKFGALLYYFEEQESTNLLAADLAGTGAEEGTVVLANRQTAGKGRKGNIWFSPADLNLYCSIILRPADAHLQYIPFITALAVARALDFSGLQSDLKWPNDVLVSGKKICGILIETSSQVNRLQFTIVGCGMNVNVREFPDELKGVATSVLQETGAPVSRETLLASFLLEFEGLYGKIEQTSWTQLCAEMEKRSTYLRGCAVQVLQDGRVTEGETCGLDAYGGLIIKTAGGLETVYAGEVQTCRKKDITS